MAPAQKLGHKVLYEGGKEGGEKRGKRKEEETGRGHQLKPGKKKNLSSL